MPDQQVEQRMREIAQIAESFHDEETFEELVERTKDPSDGVRCIATCRLGNLEDGRAVPVLIGLMDDPSGRVRGMAALGLDHYQGEEAREALLRCLRNEASGDIRAMCVSSLGDIGGADEAIFAALDDPHDHVRSWAITTLNRHNRRSATDRLLGMLDDSDWAVRYFACCALIDFEVGDQRIAQTLQDLKEIDEARKMVQTFADSDVFMKVVEHFGEDEEFSKLLEAADEDELAQDILAPLRARYGEELIPYPTQDPIGDLVRQAEELCRDAAVQ